MGQVLFDKACEYLNLIERDYFGLAAWDSSNSKVNDFILDRFYACVHVLIAQVIPIFH